MLFEEGCVGFYKMKICRSRREIKEKKIEKKRIN